MFKNICTLFLFMSCMLNSTFSYAWGITGHRVIAEIAERHLNRKTLKKVQKLLGGKPMTYYANWPDEIKSDTLKIWDKTFQWHFINFSQGLSFDEFSFKLKNYPTENLYSAIQKCQETIKDKSALTKDKKIALLFLIHIIGDLEQPLHIGREKDLGGNKIKLQWFSHPTNLHSIWDSKLIDYYKYSYTEYASVLDTNSKDQNKVLSKGTLEDWIYDSYLLATRIYSELNSYKKLDYEYAYYNKEILENQLLKGGLRLAKLLNLLFNT